MQVEPWLGVRAGDGDWVGWFEGGLEYAGGDEDFEDGFAGPDFVAGRRVAEAFVVDQVGSVAEAGEVAGYGVFVEVDGYGFAEVCAVEVPGFTGGGHRVSPLLLTVQALGGDGYEFSEHRGYKGWHEL